MYNTAERKFAQALVTQLNDEFNRAHGKEMHLTPTQLIFAAKHTIETLLTDITVLETERALKEAAPPAAAVPVPADIEKKNPNGERCLSYGINGNGQAECHWPECGCYPPVTKTERAAQCEWVEEKENNNG